ncbi:RagB/SusD family nutrient uptake outer membrane protein, partial [Pararcticibacter amylolyticus]
YVLLLLCAALLSACKNYLDIVPDNVATIDNAFSNRKEAEKYLYTCYSYLPWHNTASGNVGFLGADELWTPGYDSFSTWEIGRGNQNINDPYMNFWEGRGGARDFYNAIRDCNIFLENVSDNSKVNDLGSSMRKRWLSEVMFLKAYYHFYLFRMYGPIVIADKNVPVTASADAVKQKRAPVDEVVKYITGLLDSAAAGLPDVVTDRSSELGRVTRPAALTLKAKLLLTAASPLFNGNPDYVNFKDKEGGQLFNPQFSEDKWQAAVTACKEAVDVCTTAGIKLYEFSTFYKLSDTTKIQMSIRNSVCEKWSQELIWGLSARTANEIQVDCMARIDPSYLANMWSSRERITPTLQAAAFFYTDKGVPINEDRTWKYGTRYLLRTAASAERFNIINGYETAEFNFNREPRYYADIAFDGAVWYMENSRNSTDADTWTVRAKKGQPQSQLGAYNYSVTGLWAKKLVNWKFVMKESSHTLEQYPWPEMRLADLYLMYAEALNEVGRGDEAMEWLDKVRARAGLKGVKESWTNYSVNRNKFTTRQGLRSIIQQERSIELAFEGQRFWDLRRWKTADVVLNQAIQGWTIDQEGAVGYYRPRLLYNQRFIAPRDYLWPLRQDELIINTNLVQNPGW